MGPIVRIVLRVLAGVLVGWGMPEDAAEMLWTDEELVAQVTGALIWAATEGYYALAKRRGWRL